MEDAAEEVPQRIHPDKKPCADVDGGETRRRSKDIDGGHRSISKVLDDDNLLREILLRVGFPTTLVRAALVCRCWYQHASDRGFLCRFRELHPPHLLGFYVDDRSHDSVPRFVSMPPHPPELAAVVRRMVNHHFDEHEMLRIMDSRNGSIFTIEGRGLVYELQRPLCEVRHPLCPERGIDIIPSLPRAQDRNRPSFGVILSKEDGNGLSYFYLLSEWTNATKNFMVRVYMLKGSVWCLHTSATDQIHLTLPRGTRTTLLVENKIYIAASVTDDIIVLDLTASSLSRIKLPRGVKCHSFNTILSRAGDPSGVYLIHVNDFKLFIWLHKGDSWLLVDTIFLHDLCANLRMLDNTLEDEHTGGCYISQAGDNAEFLFLKMCGCVLYLDVRNRTLRKVHAPAQKVTHCGAIYSFTMVWPPTFPPLKDGPARIAM